MPGSKRYSNTPTELKHLLVHNSKQFQLARKGELYFKAYSLILFVGTNYVNKHSINQDEMIQYTSILQEYLEEMVVGPIYIYTNIPSCSILNQRNIYIFHSLPPIYQVAEHTLLPLNPANVLTC